VGRFVDAVEHGDTDGIVALLAEDAWLTMPPEPYEYQGHASLLAGLAQSQDLLIGARALQGFGAALVAPSALSILAVTFAEGRERNWALGIFGAVGGSAASVGVIASGLLTDGPGWRWVFFINLPIGVLLIALAARFVPADRAAAGSRRFDALGASAVTAGLLLLVYGLNRGVDHGWTSPATLVCFAGALVLLTAFVRVESRTRSPLVPAVALRNRTMVAADLAGFLLFGAIFSFIFLGSLLMQQLLLYSPTRTGLAWLATSLTAFVAAGIAGARLVSAVGVRRLLVVGMALLALRGAVAGAGSVGGRVPDRSAAGVCSGRDRDRPVGSLGADRGAAGRGRLGRRPGLGAGGDDAGNRGSGRDRRGLDGPRRPDHGRDRARGPGRPGSGGPGGVPVGVRRHRRSGGGRSAPGGHRVSPRTSSDPGARR
jgi:MFS family permease